MTAVILHTVSDYLSLQSIAQYLIQFPETSHLSHKSQNKKIMHNSVTLVHRSHVAFCGMENPQCLYTLNTLYHSFNYPYINTGIYVTY